MPSLLVLAVHGGVIEFYLSFDLQCMGNPHA